MTQSTIEIYVDADACPVKDEVMRVADRHDLPVHMVSNSWMRLDDNPLINRVIVSEGPDEADNWIAERITDRDIAITADIPLASRCIERGASVLGPGGKPFTQDSIGMALAMRDLKQHLRETGEISGHNPSFTRQNRSDFLNQLENMVQAIKRR
ncbi:YaiI/YqxD family protein [Coralliovum pocilloporae]|uniref:YaiI/YqxD family protein n=1 Tax=Coralliovum pocilloporae TaxID=3066369 RepID=UPI0033073F9A